MEANLFAIITSIIVVLLILLIILILVVIKSRKTVRWQKSLMAQFFDDNQSKEARIQELMLEKKGLIRKLGDARAKVDEANLLKSNFLANMSHELRTPMNGIIGFTQLLRDELTPDKREQYVGIVVDSGEQLVQLLDNIVDISRMDAGVISFNRSPCNLDEMLFDLFTQFNEIKYKQDKDDLILRFYNLADDQVNIINTDCVRLRQVFSNLIGNALKFTHKGIIEFGFTNSSDHELLFFVKDTGIGIPEEKQCIVFERFRQVEQGSTRKYGGTGLGLYISKQIINGLNGKIWFESTPEQGSIFYFTLPYESVEINEDISFFHTTQRAFSWANMVILVVVEKESNYQHLENLLKDTEATLIWAKNDAETISMCLNGDAPNIVLMDNQMSNVDGCEAIMEIRKHKSKAELPIIIHTDYALPNDNLQYLEVGCNDYIAKPINQEALLNKIDRFLSKA